MSPAQCSRQHIMVIEKATNKYTPSPFNILCLLQPPGVWVIQEVSVKGKERLWMCQLVKGFQHGKGWS